MKKKVYGRKLSRGLNARKALFRALIRAIVKHGSIETTLAKAKAVQSDIDKLITLAKKGGLSERRRILAHLGNDRETTDGLISIVKGSFSSRNSGYTRIIKLPRRKGDRAQLAKLEWTDKVKVKEVKKSKTKKAKSDKKESKPEKKGTLKKLGALRRKPKEKKDK
jgi:large subunit ribosomal protein L17